MQPKFLSHPVFEMVKALVVPELSHLQTNRAHTCKTVSDLDSDPMCLLYAPPELEVTARKRMRDIGAVITYTASREKAQGTLSGYATSVGKFFELITTLCYSAVAILHRSRRLNVQDTQYLMGLLVAYLADVQKTHLKHSTCRGYAGQVNIWWRVVASNTLWTDHMMESTTGFIHALKKIKRFVPNIRLGLYSADIIILLRTLALWVSQSRPINLPGSRTSGGFWDTQLYNLIAAQWSFVSAATMRFGESDDPGDASFDFSERLTLSDIKDSFERDAEGNTIRIRSLNDPTRKVVNSYTGKPISMAFNSDPLNWPTLMERMTQGHPVHSVYATQTPIFRDPRGLKPVNGFFPPGRKVMTAAWNVRILRQLIEANPLHFAGRLDINGKASYFALHSFKIGHFNELLDLGATETTARTIGRWDGRAFRDYKRVSREEEFEWSRKAAQGTAKPKLI